MSGFHYLLSGELIYLNKLEAVNAKKIKKCPLHGRYESKFIIDDLENSVSYFTKCPGCLKLMEGRI